MNLIGYIYIMETKIAVHPVRTDLWREVKARAAREDKTIGEMIDIIIVKYLEVCG